MLHLAQAALLRLPAVPPLPRLAGPARIAWRRLPGLLICVAVAQAAGALTIIEARLLGRAWLEALVLAILIGTAVCTAWTPGQRWCAGIAFGAKTLLEGAVVLLGVA